VLESVAVTEPDVSVPPLVMVAETVNELLVLTEDGAVNDDTLSSAAEVTVMVPQSAVHVVPRATQTSWPPVTVGVMEKSAVPVPPACMLAIVVVLDVAVNQLPCSSAAKLVTAFCCWFVMVTLSVADVPFVNELTVFEHEYWLLVSHTELQAANAGVISNDPSIIAIANIPLLSIFPLSIVSFYFSC
jgi:hypothetical protein